MENIQFTKKYWICVGIGSQHIDPMEKRQQIKIGHRIDNEVAHYASALDASKVSGLIYKPYCLK